MFFEVGPLREDDFFHTEHATPGPSLRVAGLPMLKERRFFDEKAVRRFTVRERTSVGLEILRKMFPEAKMIQISCRILSLMFEIPTSKPIGNGRCPMVECRGSTDIETLDTPTKEPLWVVLGARYLQ